MCTSAIQYLRVAARDYCLTWFGPAPEAAVRAIEPFYPPHFRDELLIPAGNHFLVFDDDNTVGRIPRIPDCYSHNFHAYALVGWGIDNWLRIPQAIAIFKHKDGGIINVLIESPNIYDSQTLGKVLASRYCKQPHRSDTLAANMPHLSRNRQPKQPRPQPASAPQKPVKRKLAFAAPPPSMQ